MSLPDDCCGNCNAWAPQSPRQGEKKGICYGGIPSCHQLVINVPNPLSGRAEQKIDYRAMWPPIMDNGWCRHHERINPAPNHPEQARRRRLSGDTSAPPTFAVPEESAQRPN